MLGIYVKNTKKKSCGTKISRMRKQSSLRTKRGGRLSNRRLTEKISGLRILRGRDHLRKWGGGAVDRLNKKKIRTKSPCNTVLSTI